MTGRDLVKEQILVAAGEPSPSRRRTSPARGHAIECRINAEDPVTFVPSPGTIRHLNLPGGPGVRIDTYAHDGCEISPYYDSLIAEADDARARPRGGHRAHAAVPRRDGGRRDQDQRRRSTAASWTTRTSRPAGSTRASWSASSPQEEWLAAPERSVPRGRASRPPLRLSDRVDARACGGRDAAFVVDTPRRAGAQIIQLRAKGSRRPVVARPGPGRPGRGQASGAPLVLNDRADSRPHRRERSTCTWDRHDLTGTEARKVVGPNVLLPRLSTHHLDQLAAAAAEPWTTSPSGPWFPTRSK